MRAGRLGHAGFGAAGNISTILNHNRSLRVGARTKLNVAAINGSLVVAAVVGIAFGSWFAFWLVAISLVAGNLYAGGIRPAGHGRR